MHLARRVSLGGTSRKSWKPWCRTETSRTRKWLALISTPSRGLIPRDMTYRISAVFPSPKIRSTRVNGLHRLYLWTPVSKAPCRFNPWPQPEDRRLSLCEFRILNTQEQLDSGYTQQSRKEINTRRSGKGRRKIRLSSASTGSFRYLSNKPGVRVSPDFLRNFNFLCVRESGMAALKLVKRRRDMDKTIWVAKFSDAMQAQVILELNH